MNDTDKSRQSAAVRETSGVACKLCGLCLQCSTVLYERCDQADFNIIHTARVNVILSITFSCLCKTIWLQGNRSSTYIQSSLLGASSLEAIVTMGEAGRGIQIFTQTQSLNVRWLILLRFCCSVCVCASICRKRYFVCADTQDPEQMSFSVYTHKYVETAVHCFTHVFIHLLQSPWSNELCSFLWALCGPIINQRH